MNDKTESLYQQGLKAANYKMAIDALKTAVACLSRTDRPDFAKDILKLINKILADAFEALPGDLYEQLKEKTQ